MIIKGSARAGARGLAAHLSNGEKNSRVTVAEVRGTLAEDLLGAFQEIADIASGTRCKKPLYHAQINPDPTETMSPEKWARSIAVLEKNLGLSANHPRAVVFHEKHGREHAHVVWGRIDPETMKAWHDGRNYEKHELTSRQLEREFGHERVKGVFTRKEFEIRPARTPERWEMQQGDRLKADPRALRETIRTIKEHCDNGQSFAAALKGEGYILAAGDRRSFVILDPAGGVHSLSRTLDMRMPALKRYLADIDHAALPSVAAAREQLVREAPAITQPVIDRQREAYFASLAERQAERAAEQPAMQVVRAVQHEVPQTVARAADKGAGVAVKGMEAAAGAVEGLFSAIDNFLFGSTKGPQPAPAEPAPVVGAEAKRFKREADLMRPEEALASADFQAKQATYTLGVRPELVEAMRRKMEAARKREREDERDRER